MRTYNRIIFVLLILLVSIPLHAQYRQDIRRILTEQSDIKAPQQVQWKITSVTENKETGITDIYARQSMQGQPIIGTESSFHFNKNHTISFGNIKFKEQKTLRMTRRLASSAERTPSNLLSRIAEHLELPTHKLDITMSNLDVNSRKATLRANSIASGDIPFKGLLFINEEDELQYGYSVQLDLKDSDDWWEIIVNAKSGEIVKKINYTISCKPTTFPNRNRLERVNDHDHPHHKPHNNKSHNNNIQNCYLVYPAPLESPYFGPQSMANNPADAIASPYGWHDTNGAPGAEYTITRGNNAWAKEDRNGDNEGTIGFSPDGGANLVFNNTINLNNDPSTYTAGAITNLFYWNNWIHDVMYYYGFDEASGNFQEENYTDNGADSDNVNADAQNSGNCNANFSTPPDGSNPRMQMFECSQASPVRDSDLDNGVIVHEYGHGISNRLTGGPANSGCLQNTEQMGEGWSDFYAMMFTMNPNDEGTDSRGMGNYFVGNPINGGGIRPFPYSTDMAVNPQTYNHIKTAAVPHGVGSVWCSMLWEMNWALIDKFGFDPDLKNGIGGNNVALKLVTQGLKFQPCGPGFIDGRDAILRADTVLNGAVNSCLIWKAFARRGLGYSAQQNSNNSVTDGTEAFDIPPNLPLNCNDDSEFFGYSIPTFEKGCDTFTYELSFFSNTNTQHSINLDLLGFQDTVEAIFSEDPLVLPGQVTVHIIDTIGLPQDTIFDFAVLAFNGTESDTLPLQLTKFQTPQPITLTSPIDGHITAGRPITLSWDSDAESNNYRLQIAADPSFTTIYEDIILDQTSYDFSNSTSAEFQYWRVMGLNDCFQGSFSNTRTFAHRNCGTSFWDPGGTDDYPHNIDTTYILCPDNDSTSILVDFIDFAIFENSLTCAWDYVELYQGNEINASKLIGTYCQNNIDVLPNDGDIFSTDQSGCITMKFHSSSVNTTRGWEANLICLDCPTVSIDAITITEASCVGINDGIVNISIPPLKLEYTFKLANGSDTLTSFDGSFSNLEAKAYDLIIFPTHYPECSEEYISSIIVPVKSIANIDIADGCSFDTSSVLTITFNCRDSELHSYLLPDSIVSSSHVFNKLPAGNYRIIVEDTLAQEILMDSTVSINPKFITPPTAETIEMRVSESFNYPGKVTSCSSTAPTEVIYTNSNRVSISSLDTAVSAVQITSATPANDVQVKFRITHTWVADLLIYLESPDGQLHPLLTYFTNCSQDNILVTLSDTARRTHIDFTASCSPSNTGFGIPGPPYAREGIFKPETNLVNLMANGANGVWKLKVFDAYNFDEGYIEDFSISLFHDRSTQWFSDEYGQNLIHEGDTLNPFSNLLTAGQTDTLTVYESCRVFGCRSSVQPITFIINEDLSDLKQEMLDCEVHNLSVDNGIVNEFLNGEEIKVTQTIESNALINSTRNLIFEAGNTIEFKPGFQVDKNAVFEARITPCIKP